MAAPHLPMRAFGELADLDLEFGNPDRPGLVTALLAQCGDRGEPGFWWSQPVGVRTAALLDLLTTSDPRAHTIGFSARCGGATCSELFEFDLAVSALPTACDAAGAMSLQLDGKRPITLRRPTGEDLRRWRDARPASHAAAVRQIVDALLIDGEVQPGDEPALSRAIASHDPLVAFSVSCCCPACGSPNEVPVDLEAVVLARLALYQRTLLGQVHCLASEYGWTEAQVLAIPAARRERYMAFIEAAR